MAGIFPSNEDVVVEILLRLPAKSLTRFKLVCTHWLSLISGQQFCRLHTLRHPKPQPSLILRTHTLHYFYFNPVLNNHKLIPYNFTIPNPKILNSCNGLLLLQSFNLVEYHVYNSTTKQSRKIGLPDSEDFTIVMGLTLAFDPSKSTHYKIVCVRAKMKPPSARERHCRIEVYDSRSLSWKLCLEPLTAPIGADFSSGVHSCSSSMGWGWRKHGFSLPTPRIKRPSLPFHHSLPPWRQINSCSMITHVPGKITLYSFLYKKSEELVDLTNQPFYRENSGQFDSRDVFKFGESMVPV